MKWKVIDWFTGQPVPVNINVTTSVRPGHLANPWTKSVNLGIFKNNPDGSFDETIEAAMWDQYFIIFSETQPHPLLDFPVSFSEDVQIKNKETMDFGELKDTPHLFICKVKLNYISTSTDHIAFDPSTGIGNFVEFPSGVDTTFILVRPYSLKNFETNNHNFVLNYRLINENNFNTLKFDTAAIGLNDTIHVNISY